jgi:hypothetical protein
LWAALFRETGIMIPGGGTMMGPAGLPTMQVHHWTIILPWGISLLLGVVIPCILSLRNYLRGPDHDDSDDPWVVSRLQKNERRLSRLVRALKDHRKVCEAKRIRDVCSCIRVSDLCSHNRIMLQHSISCYRFLTNLMWT